MRRFCISAGSMLLLFCLLISSAASAESILSAQGTAVIEDGNDSLAEKMAIQDAYAKAVTLEVLKSVPPSSTYAVTKKLPMFLASRGTQDVTQYKITARSQQGAYLYLTVEFRINEAFLCDWIARYKYNVPQAFRPKILIAVSSNAPAEGPHEWWYMKGKKGYSLFESQLSAELALWGENLFIQAPDLGVLASGAEPLILAARFGAGLLLSGTLKYAALGAGLNQCTLNLNLIDVNSKSVLGSWVLTRRSDLPAAEIQTSLIAAFSEDLRSRIASRITFIAPPQASYPICIEGFHDYISYQKIVDALSAMNGVKSIEISSIRGHAICHVARIKGRLEDVMQAFQTSQASSSVDILVKDGAARIVINR